MSNITPHFGSLYHPVKAIIIFKKQGQDSDHYVEAYDMDAGGMPINGHPLTVRESHNLAKALTVSDRKRAQGFLIPKKLMPPNVLYLNNGKEGFAIWRTPARKRELLFSPSLKIPSGKVEVPALIWRASRNTLYVYALQTNEPDLQTPLCKAPFFNVYPDGKVCMGNVSVNIPASCSLDKFIALWEDYFFHSYFSHTIHGESPVKGNIVQLWQQLVKTGEAFPTDKLIPTKHQLQNLLP